MLNALRLSHVLPLILLLLAPVAARADGDAAGPRTITVTGESSIYVAPDEVVITVGVETFDASLDKARRDNDERSRELLAAIKAAGVEAKHVQTDDLRVSIDYQDSGPARGVKGYVTHREYRVTLKDPKKTESVVDTSLKSGANLLSGIEYRSTELRKHRDEARKMAVKAAKEKAELLAREMNEKIGRPREISEGALGYYGWGGGRWSRGSQYMGQNSFQVRDEGAGIEGETIPIGQIAITASVSVKFDLKD